MSSTRPRLTNSLIAELQPLADLLRAPQWLAKLGAVAVNWSARTVSRLDPEMQATLCTLGFIPAEAASATLTDAGFAFFGKMLVDLRAIEKVTQPLAGKYRIDETIAYGKNSITFKVEHLFLARPFVLKVVRPGSGTRLEEALKVLGRLADVPQLVQPVDYFEFDHVSLSGASVPLQCVVYPYVDGVTLAEYLEKSPPLSPYFVAALIEQLVRPLAALERLDAYHGDLHSKNILVRQPAQGRISFYIIDVSFGIGTPSDYAHTVSDFEQFQEHLWRALEMLQRTLARMSLQKHLGARIFSLVSFILEGPRHTFAEILACLETDRLYQEFVRRRSDFLKEKFRTPAGLYLLRYEEFTTPSVAIELFEPFPGLLNNISRFGNALLYGHRGSGKSTYLAALAFFPELTQPGVDFSKTFGIFFACRQGEFKQYSSELLDFSATKMLNFKHILVLKVIRRLVQSLAEAVRGKALRDATSHDSLYTFLRDYVGCGDLGSYDTAIVSPLENLHAALLRGEILEIDDFFGRQACHTDRRRAFDEKALIDFLLLVKSAFLDLSETQFYLLFDDAGSPNVPIAAQRVINDLARATNSVYCVKLSAERYSYSFEDTTGKAIEDPHDISVFDISQVLFLGSGKNPERDEVEQYFKQILRRRLQYWQYQSFNITDYIGDELVPVDDLVEALATGRRNAYYAGWQVVWQLADRTVRNLLEIVNSIFAVESIGPLVRPHILGTRIQDRAVRSVSERKLRALSYIPGTISIFGKEVSLGRRLYEFTAAFGAVAQSYLKHGHAARRTRGKRFDERIAIERNDFRELREPARLFLEALIRYGVLDDSHLAFARDDHLKKPLYILNRIFCPAFGISFRREQHLRLTTGRFELLLLDPIAFAQSGTAFLQKFGSSEVYEDDLFNR